MKDKALKVLNPSIRLMSVAAGVKLEFEVQIDMGRGYVPSEVNEKYVDVVGTIPMDAIFSPVTKVRYAVEPTRVGHRSDYDKLVLEVWTDGTLRPEDALAEAAKIAKDHFSIFVNFDEGEMGADEESDEIDERIHQILATPVEELELSVRSSNCLKNANIKTIGDLTKKTEDDIAKTRNFGKKSLQEIKDRLNEWNLNLGSTDYADLRAHLKSEKQKEETHES
jgi:DNA-directed RNA polymerase subunit alpha